MIFSHELYHAKSSHFDSDVIYLDYKKAFDSVVHNRLLYKLWEYGIRGDLWRWFQAYLNDRRQCVRVGGQFSCFLPVVSGVPQGSLLGPLFYIIFINDVFAVIREAKALVYADDTKLFMTIQGPFDSTILQDNVNAVSEWSSFWELSLNPSKCSYVNYHFNKAFPNYEYLINHNAVSTTDQIKDLGIIFSSNLLHYKFIISIVRPIRCFIFYGIHLHIHLLLPGDVCTLPW